MAIYKRDIADIELENGNIYRSFLNRSIGMSDNVADHFGVRVFRNGQPVDLTGVTVQGYFKNPQGENIAITSGNIVTGNTAEVILPQACYNYEGQFCLAIKLIGGGVTGTIRIIDGMVDNTNTGGAVAPTGTVPTYQEVLAVYEDAIEAVDEVNQLREDFNKLRIPGGKNLFDEEAITKSKYIDGSGDVVDGGTSYDLSDYIPIDGDLTISYESTGSVSGVWVSLFDSSKNWLSRTSYTGSQFTVSGNGYIRINLWAPTNTSGQMDYGTIMVNSGEYAETYEPYYSAYDFVARNMITPTAVNSSNYQRILPDANEAEREKTYIMVFSPSAEIPANLPVDHIISTTAALICRGASDTSRVQIFISELVMFFRRAASASTWNSWVCFGNQPIYVGPSRTITKLKDGIEEATKRFGSVVYVDPGVYDLVDEFGDDYFAAIDAESTSKQGIALYNNVHVIFASNSKVVCNYTGSNDYAKIKFSPFNAEGNHGFILENLTLECSNVRYCVHDEQGTNPIPYRNEYRNCSMFIDNSGNTAWNSRQCIGGGLGRSGEIICKDCYFKSIGSYANNGTISWHNSSHGAARSRIVIDGCYFDGDSSTVRFGWYGTSEAVTDCYVRGCSMSADPVIRAETPQSTTENMKMYAWGNDIRA